MRLGASSFRFDHDDEAGDDIVRRFLTVEVEVE
jgi:hypothetical protein